jgi:hypothetical protein
VTEENSRLFLVTVALWNIGGGAWECLWESGPIIRLGYRHSKLGQIVQL